MPVRHDERGRVDDPAVQLHLTAQATKTVSVRLDLITMKQAVDDRDVDAGLAPA
jgi:hypothetical protein